MIGLVLALLATVQPDTSAILLLDARLSFAEACPISEHFALTAAHVIDPDPLDKDSLLVGSRFVSGNNNIGVVFPVGVSLFSDLGLLYSAQPFREVYRVSASPPAKGDEITYVYREFDSKKKFFERKTKTVKVHEVQGGTIISDDQLELGSSGSCVLNKDNEIVGIVAKVWLSMDRGFIIGIWGDWLDLEGITEQMEKFLKKFLKEKKKDELVPDALERH